MSRHSFVPRFSSFFVCYWMFPRGTYFEAALLSILCPRFSFFSYFPPVSQSQVVQWYICYISMVELIHSAVNYTFSSILVSNAQAGSMMRTSLFALVYTTTSGLLALGCLDRNVAQVFSSDSRTLSVLRWQRIFPLLKFHSIISGELFLTLDGVHFLT